MSDLSDVKVVHDRLAEIQLVDCREPYEWEAGRVEGAIHIPVNRSWRAQAATSTRPSRSR